MSKNLSKVVYDTFSKNLLVERTKLAKMMQLIDFQYLESDNLLKLVHVIQ